MESSSSASTSSSVPVAGRSGRETFYVRDARAPARRATARGRVRGRRTSASYLASPRRSGLEFAPHKRRTSRCASPTSPQARAELEAKGVEFIGETLDTGVCHMAFFSDPDGNALMLHRRVRSRVTVRAAAARALPRPPAADTTRGALALHRPAGLRPGRVRRERRDRGRRSAELDARYRRRRRRAASPRRDRDRARARMGSASSRSTTHPSASTRSSARTRSSPLTTRRCGSTACSSACRRASCSSSRSTSGSRTPSTAARSSGACSSSPRRAAAFTLIEEYVSASPELAGYTNAAAELFVEQAREARVRLAPEPLAGDVALRLPPRARRARRRARLGRRRLRLEEGQGPDPERPRRPGRHLARHRRLLRRRRPAPRLRHLPGAHRAEHDLRLRLQGRAARRGDAPSGAG